jgi:GT2 family glycosyltransferase
MVREVSVSPAPVAEARSLGPQPPRSVAVAVLSWNGRQHLETCLQALAVQEDPGVPWEILVLDNGSSDGTAAWLRRVHPEVRLIRSEVNLGFCAGNNLLMREAVADAVALLNNDTRPEPAWLRGLVAALSAASGDVAAVSGLIVDWQAERLDFARGILTFDGHALQDGFRRPLAVAPIPEDGAELLFACGGNLLVRRHSFLAAGGFDEDFFAYYEDVDLGWRLWSGGERILFARAAVVRHRSSATSDLLGLYNRGFLFERNAFLIAYKNYESGWWERMMPAVLMTFLARTQTLLVENNPHGVSLALDPYAGFIADTAGAAVAPPVPDFAAESLRAKWRRMGIGEFLWRGARRLWRQLGRRSAPATAPAFPELRDERTIAQFRAWSYLLRHLDSAAAKRTAVQGRRRRSDADIFARFPLHVVATYPGDETLFASPGFRSWLPAGVPFVERRLEDIVG